MEVSKMNKVMLHSFLLFILAYIATSSPVHNHNGQQHQSIFRGTAFVQNIPKDEQYFGTCNITDHESNLGIYKPHPTDCTQYLKCDHGRFIAMPCHINNILHWNACESACDWPQLAQCVAGVERDCPAVPAPEVPAPEVPAPEVPAPEVPVPEVPVPEVPVPEVPVPEEPEPEVPEPEVPEPEVPEPEVPGPEVPEPEPEFPQPEVPEPEGPPLEPPVPEEV